MSVAGAPTAGWSVRVRSRKSHDFRYRKNQAGRGIDGAQAWRGWIGELCPVGIVEELEEVAVLLAAGGDCGPHALVTLASIAACTLRDAAVPGRNQQPRCLNRRMASTTVTGLRLRLGLRRAEHRVCQRRSTVILVESSCACNDTGTSYPAVTFADRADDFHGPRLPVR